MTPSTPVFAIAAVLAMPATTRGAAPRDYEGPRAVASTKTATTPTPIAPIEPEPDEAIEPEPTSEPPRPRSIPPSAIAETMPMAEPRREVRLRLGLDLAITIGLAAPSLALGLWVEPSLPTRMPMPGAEADVGKFDALALGRYEDAPAIASDVLLAVSIAAPLGYHAVEAALQRRGYSRIRGRGFFARYLTDLVLIAEAISINAFVTEVLKASFSRPRPYTYLDPSDVPVDRRQDLVDAQNGHGADWSFPSGHTSTAFVASTAGATLLTLELLGRRKWPIAVAWVAGTGVSATTAVMRVLAGRHFPSDVVTSALIGTGIGVAVPLAHWRPTPAGDRVELRGVMRSWTVAPMGGRDMIGLRFGGALP